MKRRRAEIEPLFVEPVTSEHTEMYLKAVWLLRRGQDVPCKISELADALHVAPPSVVGMLKRLEDEGYIEYLARKGVMLTGKGEPIATAMVRNSRIVEVLMRKSLEMNVDERVACGLEHHMTTEFTDGLCILLKHPRRCPHGYPIPRGGCCPPDT